MSDDIIHDIGSAEDETNEFYHKWLDRKAEAEDLSRKLEEARGRIAELEHELKQERLWKLTPDEHRDYLEARHKSVSHDLELAAARESAKDARIAELQAAIKPFAAGYDHFAWADNANPFRDDHVLVSLLPDDSITVGHLRNAHNLLEGKDNG